MVGVGIKVGVGEGFLDFADMANEGANTTPIPSATTLKTIKNNFCFCMNKYYTIPRFANSPIVLYNIEDMDKKSIFSPRQWLVFSILVCAWLASVWLFWGWWLRPEHRGDPLLFWLVSFAFFYDGTFLPTMFLYYLGRAKKPVTKKVTEKLSTAKVAMISLTVPGSEALEIVERQLVAMKAVKFPHDSWILVDKVHSPEIAKLAKKHGVKYFCRHDADAWGADKVAYWNQSVPPFKAKTKAGNVNAWIDAHGAKYDYFTQLDIDHLPIPEYLDKVLGYFAKPTIAWVQAPSVYGNLEYWTAKGAAEQELVLQGPLQMGFYGSTDTPFIIGSHSTYRMSAVKEIGGFQPTRAEDHLDTLYLATKGYTGVFLPEVIATGDGPETFEIYLSQQFAWAYSLVQVLMSHAPKALWRLKPSVALQMLFAETWYPLWTLAMLTLFISPSIALITGRHISVVNFWDFTLRSAGMGLVGFAAWLWSRRWHQPKGLGLSWRGIMLHSARWVVVFSAIIQAVFRVKKPYMITQKGGNEGKTVSIGALMPYIILLYSVLGVCLWYISRVGIGPTQGYLLFSLEGAFFMSIVAILPVVLLIKEHGWISFKNHKLALSVIGIAFIVFIVDSLFAYPLVTKAIWNESEQPMLMPVANTIITPTVTPSPTPVPSISTSNIHIVQNGESLWSIAQKYYGDGSKWPHLSRSFNSTTIHPGDRIEYNLP